LNGKTNPGNNGRWDLRDKKFIRPNTVELESWAVGIVDGCLDEDTVRNFIRVLIQQYQGHGGKVKNRNPAIYKSNRNENIADCTVKTREKALRQCEYTPFLVYFTH
jgi:eukaryotic translation initiation factor 2C